MKKLLLTSLLFISVISFGQVPSYVPTSSLVGWWDFNGNALDESGNGNNGTVNGPVLTDDRFGNPIVHMNLLLMVLLVGEVISKVLLFQIQRYQTIIHLQCLHGCT